MTHNHNRMRRACRRMLGLQFLVHENAANALRNCACVELGKQETSGALAATKRKRDSEILHSRGHFKNSSGMGLTTFVLVIVPIRKIIC